ncbi:MAG: hypothetical protein ACK58L_11830 [Planctomycetota bacterium]
MSKSQRVRVTFVCESSATQRVVEQLNSDASAIPQPQLSTLPSDQTTAEISSDWIAATDQVSANSLRQMLAAVSERLHGGSDPAVIVVHPSKAIPRHLLERFPESLHPWLRPVSAGALRLLRITDTRNAADLISRIRSAWPVLSLECDVAIDITTLPHLGPGKLTSLRCPVTDIQRATSFWKSNSTETQCVESGLLLLHDHLDESHSISQAMEGLGKPQTGDYWHGIMHRREPDAGNASYWFRRVGHHPAMDELGTQLIPWMTELGCSPAHLELATQTLVRKQLWDPAEMIRLSSIALRSRGSVTEQTCRIAQYLEMINLLAWSVSK